MLHGNYMNNKENVLKKTTPFHMLTMTTQTCVATQPDVGRAGSTPRSARSLKQHILALGNNVI